MADLNDIQMKGRREHAEYIHNITVTVLEKLVLADLEFLDVGAGSNDAILPEYVKDQKGKYRAIDISEAAIERLRWKLGGHGSLANFEVGDILGPGVDGSAEVIFARSVLSHLDPAIRDEAMRHMLMNAHDAVVFIEEGWVQTYDFSLALPHTRCDLDRFLVAFTRMSDKAGIDPFFGSKLGPKVEGEIRSRRHKLSNTQVVSYQRAPGNYYPLLVDRCAQMIEQAVSSQEDSLATDLVQLRDDLVLLAIANIPEYWFAPPAIVAVTATL